MVTSSTTIKKGTTNFNFIEIIGQKNDNVLAWDRLRDLARIKLVMTL